MPQLVTVFTRVGTGAALVRTRDGWKVSQKKKKLLGIGAEGFEKVD